MIRRCLTALGLALGLAAGCATATSTGTIAQASAATATTRHLCADHQTGQMESGSSTRPFSVITCGGLKRPPAGMHWVAINDGSDNDWDARDVVIYLLAPDNANQAPPSATLTGCPFPVHIAYNTFLGPPGKAQASWETSPSSCPSKLRVEIKSAGGFTYHSGWIVSTNIGTITAATAKDGTQLQWARIEVKVTATGTVWCDRVYATVGKWRICTNPSPARAALAVAIHRLARV